MAVEPEIIQWLASDDGFVVHLGVFVFLLLGGLGFPIPEDIPILLGGVSVAKHIVAWNSMFLTCFIGVMIGDQTMFFIGHRFGQRLLSAGTRSRFFPSITQERVNEVREGLRKRRLLYIFIARHLFPIRSVTFVVAGALRVPYWEFLLCDFFAALVSVSLVMLLGYWLGGKLTPEAVEHLARQANFYILAAVVIIFLISVTAYTLSNRRAKKKVGPPG